MVVGLVVWELHIPGCASLKEKRSVVKSLKDRLHAKFNVSAAETAHQDLLQRSEIAVTVVSGDRKHAQSVLSSADRLVAEEGRARIIDSYTTFY
ncbi:MAG TPA: DUF503 domain-containing protein [Longimicrobium sp.]|jgi:hypothetical protein|uniref:DUF503 domain-containing protein n=1 Tax=Longimicrobium sp. TaxID=2029185 RepID=UPI002EDB2EA0